MQVSTAEQARQLMQDPSRYEGLREMSSRDQELQLWIEPAFDPYVSWTLYCERRRNEQDQYWVRRVVWDQRQDWTKRQSINQPIGCDGIVDHKVAKRLMTQLANLKADVLFPTSNMIGLDGISYGIKAGSNWCHTEISWWCDPPDEWHGVLDFLVNSTEKFNQILPESTLKIDFSRYT